MKRTSTVNSLLHLSLRKLIRTALHFCPSRLDSNKCGSSQNPRGELMSHSIVGEKFQFKSKANFGLFVYQEDEDEVALVF